MECSWLAGTWVHAPSWHYPEVEMSFGQGRMLLGSIKGFRHLLSHLSFITVTFAPRTVYMNFNFPPKCYQAEKLNTLAY